ncbi:glycosyltransferase [Pseudalkalibacillus sp. R45]|uniref:glycosyltransferase n=1 Tax=Pseudalkalibacillus sp. R45 TaxID=3457433 RepID=UPI003FCD2E0B
MKLLILAPANNPHTKKWLAYYNDKGYETINVSFDSHEDTEDRSHWQNVKTIYLNLKMKSKLAYFLTVPELQKILKKEKPEIFHSHYVSSYGVIGAMAGYHPYVISVWGSDIYDFPKENTINKRLVKYALSKADAIGSTSEVMKVETAQYTNKNIDVTPFGVDMNKFSPDPSRKNPETVTFGIVKTMKPKYGIKYLVEGYKKFKDNVSDEAYRKTRLVIVGGGPQLEEYEGLAKELGIEDQTEFTGNIPHEKVPDMINTFDVFFVPSVLDSESFGVAAVEAQACGVPVVVSNVGGLPEVVRDEHTGYIIPSENSEAIAEKMAFLVDKEDMRTTLGNNGREHVVSHYKWEDNAELMSEIYNRILSKRG